MARPAKEMSSLGRTTHATRNPCSFRALSCAARWRGLAVKAAIILNEKEAGIMFPRNNGEEDMTKMLYGNDPSFHEWCFDYFKDCWDNSTSFQESKLQ